MTDLPAETVDPITARANEVAQYDANISMYKTIAATLPTEWPEHLTQYRGATDQHTVIGQVENLDDVTLLSRLWYADEVQRAIRAETLERTKAAAILDVMQATA